VPIAPVFRRLYVAKNEGRILPVNELCGDVFTRVICAV
jgi:hypothetical protein